LRAAAWRDKAAAWQIAQHNTPESLTFAEPFDRSMYQLGLRWWLVNSFSGSTEHWWVADRMTHGTMHGMTHGPLLGVVRTHVNYEGPEHHLELMLAQASSNMADMADTTNTSTDMRLDVALHLARLGLRRFEMYLSKPIYAAQSRPHEVTHTALQLLGFQPTRELIHMRLAL
jgi:hypothetical protein